MKIKDINGESKLSIAHKKMLSYANEALGYKNKTIKMPLYQYVCMALETKGFKKPEDRTYKQWVYDNWENIGLKNKKPDFEPLRLSDNFPSGVRFNNNIFNG